MRLKPQTRRKIAPLVALAFLFTIIIPIYYPSIILRYSKKVSDAAEKPAAENKVTDDVKYKALVSDSEHCDLSSGEWVPNPEGPHYTNMTCDAKFLGYQNCMNFPKRNAEFLKWKWKPDACDLPIFDPHQFLELVRGKSMAFVGDSLARNHMESLICLLSKVNANSVTSDELAHYEYREYNFNMSLLSSPHLVRAETVFDLYLDEIDESWKTKIQSFDYVIMSAGHWFFHPAMFYLNHRLVGCLDCAQSNVSHLTSYFSYQSALQTAFRAINSLQNYNGVIFLRTFSPSHFENGTWSNGGVCTRTRPFRRNEKVLDSHNLEFYKIQLRQLRIAQKEGRERGVKFRLLDVTRPMLLRPDGHPSKYCHSTKPNPRMLIDCLHWCLPGPIDTWNDFLLQLLKREAADI